VVFEFLRREEFHVRFSKSVFAGLVSVALSSPAHAAPFMNITFDAWVRKTERRRGLWGAAAPAGRPGR
jgi:hypothetical protein